MSGATNRMMDHAMHRATRDPVSHGCAALLRALAPEAGPFDILSSSSRRWASALFLGSRHRLSLALEGDDGGMRAKRLQADLSERELGIIGGFVADILVTAKVERDRSVLAIEALLIDEPDPPPEVSAGARPVD